ncbi:MarR family winged helix-turn-helix transcriptional regulator [Actinocrispum wychmicini]|uniref:DNA-binding MarR family transcriptional regulator n=1 Tax=Actinocrispum wychmicini TaxID=1213861 RepID=A0A4R2ISR4_9PSEU|nr:MarR family transcriptional regulator [Actinocrispum wychmicini]TCO45835.1 DNA-binding MarR family transcriptional regulator [Actinocrispum wychmicini]
MEETVSAECTEAQRCLEHYDLNWLMSRAAHDLRQAMDAEAATHGTTIRGQIVLTAIVQQRDQHLTQLALSTRIGLDKTTMTAVLDKLEAQGLLVRTPDPNDRRARIPVVTEQGRELQAKLYRSLQDVEDRVFGDLTEDEREHLRVLLRRIITPGPVEGSCM